MNTVKKPPTPVTIETLMFKVVDPSIDPALPNFPSTSNSACKNLESYLNKLHSEGYEAIFKYDQFIGADKRQLIVLKKAT